MYQRLRHLEQRAGPSGEQTPRSVAGLTKDAYILLSTEATLPVAAGRGGVSRGCHAAPALPAIGVGQMRAHKQHMYRSAIEWKTWPLGAWGNLPDRVSLHLRGTSTTPVMVRRNYPQMQPGYSMMHCSFTEEYRGKGVALCELRDKLDDRRRYLRFILLKVKGKL